MNKNKNKNYFPRPSDVALELRHLLADLQAQDPGPELDQDVQMRMDVRLQVYEDGRWAIRTGDAGYDQDHHGFWGSSSVSYNDTSEDMSDIANDLLHQVLEQVSS